MHYQNLWGTQCFRDLGARALSFSVFRVKITRGGEKKGLSQCYG